jgi:hypothetical protein
MLLKQLGGAFEHRGAFLAGRRRQAGKPAAAAAIAARAIASSPSRTTPMARPSMGEIAARSIPGSATPSMSG